MPAEENKTFDEFDDAYDRALERGEVLPFGRFQRADDHAYKFRDVRRVDPCTFKQVFRRKTLKAETLEIIEDIYKADLPENFKWKATLPGQTPMATITIYYYYLGDDATEQLQVAHKKEARKLLPTPALPSKEEQERHKITHTPFAAWCEDCVAGRSRGEPHRQTQKDGFDEFEFDYTYYSEVGFEVRKDQTDIERNVF